MPGTESQKAFDLLEQRFPGVTAPTVPPPGSSSSRPSGEKMTDTDNKAAVEEAVAELADGSQVAAVDPFQAQAVSEDGTTAYATVTYKVDGRELTDASQDASEGRRRRGPGRRADRRGRR